VADREKMNHNVRAVPFSSKVTGSPRGNPVGGPNRQLWNATAGDAFTIEEVDSMAKEVRFPWDGVGSPYGSGGDSRKGRG